MSSARARHGVEPGGLPERPIIQPDGRTFRPPAKGDVMSGPLASVHRRLVGGDGGRLTGVRLRAAGHDASLSRCPNGSPEPEVRSPESACSAESKNGVDGTADAVGRSGRLGLLHQQGRAGRPLRAAGRVRGSAHHHRRGIRRPRSAASTAAANRQRRVRHCDRRHAQRGRGRVAHVAAAALARPAETEPAHVDDCRSGGRTNPAANARGSEARGGACGGAGAGEGRTGPRRFV